jgi:hypothetical protein
VVGGGGLKKGVRWVERGCLVNIGYGSCGLLMVCCFEVCGLTFYKDRWFRFWVEEFDLMSLYLRRNRCWMGCSMYLVLRRRLRVVFISKA